ncbi:MAG: alpha/beta hydrolase [Ignavibacteriae bacterium]|nr:alpha/beta hydrolase [Ignavibacteriota bacterium]
MDSKIKEEYIVIDQIRTHITHSGERNVLLLIHGLGGPLMWQRVLEPLSQHFQVVIVDLPGFGDSDCPPEQLTTEQYAEFIVLLMDSLNTQKATLIGISYGGQISITVTSLYPKRVEKLILIASTGLTPSRFFTSGILWSMVSTFMKNVFLRNRFLLRLSSNLAFYDKDIRPPGLLENFYHQISQKGKRDAWINCMRNAFLPNKDFSQQLSHLHVPTLILWGENDRTISRKYAFEFRKHIPHSKVQIFSRCAHSVPLEKPGELCDAIVEFAK